MHATKESLQNALHPVRTAVRYRKPARASRVSP